MIEDRPQPARGLAKRVEGRAASPRAKAPLGRFRAGLCLHPPGATWTQRRLEPYGVYQIGALYALSWVAAGAPSGIGIPNRNAS